jgi:hypothetical protein
MKSWMLVSCAISAMVSVRTLLTASAMFLFELPGQRALQHRHQSRYRHHRHRGKRHEDDQKLPRIDCAVRANHVAARGHLFLQHFLQQEAQIAGGGKEITLPQQDPSLMGVTVSINGADQRPDQALAKVTRSGQSCSRARSFVSPALPAAGSADRGRR